MVPLLFSMLVIVPPQVYFERIFNGATFSYTTFYPTVFEGIPYPHGNLSWHHMWFVLYLFFYSLIGLPVFLYLRSANGKKVIATFIERTRKIHGLIIVLPTVLIAVCWSFWSDRTHDFIHDMPWHAYWFSFFFMGYFTGTSERVWQSIEKNRRLYLGLAFLSILIVNTVRWNDQNSGFFFAIHPALGYTYLGIFAANGWFWLLAALGYGKKYLNSNHKILPYANQAIYPFYILHQTVIIIIGFYVIQTEESILAKYLFVSTLSLVASLAIYEFLIRPFRWMRFVFGVKEIKKPVAKDFSSIEDRAEFKAA